MSITIRILVGLSALWPPTINLGWIFEKDYLSSDTMDAFLGDICLRDISVLYVCVHNTHAIVYISLLCTFLTTFRGKIILFLSYFQIVHTYKTNHNIYVMSICEKVVFTRERERANITKSWLIACTQLSW